MVTSPTTPVDVFYSYAHEDEALRDEVHKALVMLKDDGLIREWHDREITAGTGWRGQIEAHLESADVILLLLSRDFLFSDFCRSIEMGRALERHAAGTVRVIPIILRPCDWQASPLADLQALPQNALAVTSWSGPDGQDRAFLDITRGIRRAIQELRPS